MKGIFVGINCCVLHATGLGPISFMGHLVDNDKTTF